MGHVRSSVIVAASLAILSSAQTSIRFGPHYSLGPTKSQIIESITTISPGNPPNPQQDRLALWAGMGCVKDDGSDGGPLLQAIILSASNPKA